MVPSERDLSIRYEISIVAKAAWPIKSRIISSVKLNLKMVMLIAKRE